MGFLDALRGRVSLAGQEAGETSHAIVPPGAVTVPAELETSVGPSGAGLYDREQWRRKLKRILEKLPQSEHDWAHLEQEARALDFGDTWITHAYLDELALMIRKIVSDRVVTAEEHRKIDLARSLMGITDDEAECMVHTIVVEAEQFFGKSIEGA